MFKTFFKKSIMMFVGMSVVVGVLITTLPIFDSVNSTTKKSQTFNKKEVTKDYQNAYKNSEDDALYLLSGETQSADNSQSDNANAEEPINVNPKVEKSSNNIDKRTTTSYQTKNENSNVNKENQGSTNSTPEIKTPTIDYDRTTSIYADDEITLLRVEYYKNNKLIYYSVVEQFDASIKSYVEKIYQCNRETNIDPLIRTDVYVNGNLVKSY